MGLLLDFLKIPRFMRALDATIIIVLENVILLFFVKKCYIAKTVVFLETPIEMFFR